MLAALTWMGGSPGTTVGWKRDTSQSTPVAVPSLLSVCLTFLCSSQICVLGDLPGLKGRGHFIFKQVNLGDKSIPNSLKSEFVRFGQDG